MVDMFNNVKEFQIAVGQHVGTKPEFPSGRERKLRMDLMLEEVEEYMESEDEEDLVNLAKELADIIYIVCGTAASYGIPLNEVFKEVHRSNMEKLVDGKPIRREDGKILKPDGWVAPNIKKVLFGE